MKTKGIVKSLFDFETKEHQILLRKWPFTDENQDLTINHDYISCTLWTVIGIVNIYTKNSHILHKLRLKIKA